MCGIAGFVTANPAWGRLDLERMTNIIRHRGPDAGGFYCKEPAFLGHRRLSIIDVAAGSQPMANEAGDKWIVYNGEIFNHAAIRPGLERAGHRYQTRCDTETILHGYEEYGEDCVSRFRGMFAFAVWDERAQTLFCARDRLGIKPFYYFWDGRLFAFASEIKALLEHPAIAAALDESVFQEYLALGYGTGDRTLFAGIRKLMPGHLLTLNFGDPSPLRMRRYWDVQPVADVSAWASDDSWVRECRRRLEETVRMRLMSDVPLGMFLSGGVDSSAVAALVTRMVPDRLNTFSVGYAEEAYSELRFAREVSAWVGSNHHETVISRDDFFNALPSLIWHEDEPIVWPSSVSLFFVSRLASERVKVVLTGEGGDELFGGYHRYRTYLLNHRLASVYRCAPRRVREFIRRRIASTSLLSASMRRKLGHTLLGRECDLESLYLENFHAAFSRAELAEILVAPKALPGPFPNYLAYWNAAHGLTPLGQLLYADQKTYLVELLMKQDQMSMACSIESRVPFLDHPFVEFAAAVPDRLKIHGGSGKYILKKAVEDLLPPSIVYRRKMGFPTPLRGWLLEPGAKPWLDRLTAPGNFLSNYLDIAAVRRMRENHERGFKDSTDSLWRLLNFEIWAERVLKYSPRSELVGA